MPRSESGMLLKRASSKCVDCGLKVCSGGQRWCGRERGIEDALLANCAYSWLSGQRGQVISNMKARQMSSLRERVWAGTLQDCGQERGGVLHGVCVVDAVSLDVLC